jgi:hypothetical protein
VLANTEMSVWAADTRRGKTAHWHTKARLGDSDTLATPLSLALCCGPVLSPPRRDACYLVTSDRAGLDRSQPGKYVLQAGLALFGIGRSLGSHQTHALTDVHSRPLQLMGGALEGRPNEPHGAGWLCLTRTPP